MPYKKDAFGVDTPKSKISYPPKKAEYVALGVRKAPMVAQKAKKAKGRLE